MTRKPSAGAARPAPVRAALLSCIPLALSCAPAAAQTMRERMNAPEAFRQDPSPLAPGSGIDASRPFSQPQWQSAPPAFRGEPEERRPLKPLFVPPVKPQR